MKGMAFNPGLRRDSGYWDYMSSIRRLQIICVFRRKQINFRTLKGHKGYFPSLNPRTSAALCDWTSDGQDDENRLESDLKAEGNDNLGYVELCPNSFNFLKSAPVPRDVLINRDLAPCRRDQNEQSLGNRFG